MPSDGSQRSRLVLGDGTAMYFPAADAAQRAPVAQLGGKGANLQRLCLAGLPVPGWFCVPTAVFDQVVAPHVDADVARLAALDFTDTAAVSAMAVQLQQRIQQLKLPCELRARLREAVCQLGASHANTAHGAGPSYAVRSSAVSEDSATHSFAGQLDSYMHVRAEHIGDRIIDCWASAFSSGALLYAHACGQTGVGSVAVVVQTMVDSVSAGVLFTANPTGSLDEQVIVAGYGLGEGIVAGQVPCDTYVFDAPTKRWSVQVANKQTHVTRDTHAGTGTVVVQVDAARAKLPALTVGQRHALLHLAEQICAITDDYQDIEWAVDQAGTIHLLQTRPITTLPQGTLSVFDNSNIVESYPGVTLPLTFSYIQKAYERIFTQAVLRLGVARRVVENHEAIFGSMLGFASGRVYYNLTNWYQMFRLVPGTRPYIPVWEQMLGLPASSDTSRTVPLGERIRRIPPLLRGVGSLAWHFAAVGFLLRRVRARFERTQKAFRALPLRQLDAAAFEPRFRSMLGREMNGWEVTLLNDGYAFIFSSLVRTLLRRRGIDEQLFGPLMAGDHALESVGPARSSVAMAEWLRARPPLFAHLRAQLDAAPAAALALLEEAQFAEFQARFQHHLDQFGDRCLEELKLESPTLRDEPATLLHIVLGYVPSALSVTDMVAAEHHVRRAAEQQVSAALRFRPLSRLVLRFCLAMARRSIRLRESSRLDRARAFGMVRSLFSELGRRLSDAGALEQPRDVFYLRFEELFDFVNGKLVERELSPTVERRKQAFQSYHQSTPLERFRTRGPVGANTIPLRRSAPSACEARDHDLSAAHTPTHAWQGTGCSSGIVEGEAIVIKNPREAGDVSGKILVAEMTDPGWVFLMISAAGLVVERGSLLSHTAIIGRELGKPTVVGVVGATEFIQPGDLLLVDGQTGSVRRVAPELDAATPVA